MDYWFLFLVFYAIAAMAGWLFAFEEHRKSKNKKLASNFTSWAIAIAVIIVGAVLPMMAIQSYVDFKVKETTDHQRWNCDNSINSDGKPLTEAQCEYFNDVLNGKYVRDE